MSSGFWRFIEHLESESAATDIALRKWMEGAICTKDGSIGDMGLRRCMVTVRRDVCDGTD
jgi:hypothetical protein